MKHEETVPTHSRYKQQRDGGDGLPDVITDVDGMFFLAATSVCWFGLEGVVPEEAALETFRTRVRDIVCSANHLPFNCCQLQDGATNQMFCIVHLPNH